MFDSTLIQTKYCLPRANPSAISRGRLLEKLGRAPGRALTLVVAPMGYGKTTAVYEWVEKSGLPAAWLSLDESDDDPVVFWKYICAAMESIVPGITDRADYALSSRQLLEANVPVNILLDELARHGGEAVLVLDDLHAVTDPQIMKGLSHLLTYLPANAQVIIASREEPAMALDPLELRSQVLRVTARDLQFRQDEIADFYRGRDCAFGRENIEKVARYTGGWAAAMVAVAVSAQNDCVGGDLPAGTAAENSDLYHYLMSEVFASFEPSKRAFLLKISVLEFLQEDVCRAVAGEDNAARFFEEMRRNNEFVTQLGDEGGAYRLHPILRNFLLEKLREGDAGALCELHARAARWYHGRGLLPLAVSHYLSAAQYAEALALIEVQLGNFASKNEYETAHGWIGRLPEIYRQNSVKIAVFYSMNCAQRREFEQSRRWLARAREILAQSGGESGAQDRALVGLAAVNLLLREGDVQELLRLIRKKEIPDSSAYKTIAYMDLNDSDVWIYRSPVHLLIKLFEADREAFDKLRGYHDVMSTHRPGFMPLAIAESHFEHNRLDEALPLFLEAAEAARLLSYPGVLVPAMAGIARVKRSRGDKKGALAVLEECESELKTIHKPHWNDLLSALKTRCLIEAGDIDRVEAWITTNKLHLFSEINRVREFELIVLARALWAQNNTGDAEILLMRLLSFAESQGRPHSRVEILNLLAMIACQKGSARLAAEYLEKSLRTGLAEGYLRSYLDEGAPMLPVLRQAASSLVKAGGAARELASFADSLLSLTEQEMRAVSGGGETGDLNLKNLLTAKERDVLELLCAACSNEEIGRALNISPRTVKAHAGSIYNKLGVKTRAQCVKLAYEKGFLQPHSR